MKKSLYLIFALSACIHAAEQEEYYNSPRIIDQFIQYYKNFSEYLLETPPDTPPLLSEEEHALRYSVIPKKLRTYFSQEDMPCNQEIKDLFIALITRPYHRDIATFLANVYKKQFIKFEHIISPKALYLICKKYSKDLPELAFDFMHKASFKNDDIMCTYLTVLDGYYDLFQSFNENKQLVVYSLVKQTSYQSLLFLLNHKDLSIEKITQKNPLWNNEHTLLHKFICGYRYHEETDVSKKVIAKTIEILKQHNLLNKPYALYMREYTKEQPLIVYAFEPYPRCSNPDARYTHERRFPDTTMINLLLNEPTLQITDLDTNRNGGNTLLHLYIYHGFYGNATGLLQKIINCLAKKNALNQKNNAQETALGNAFALNRPIIVSMLLDHPSISVLNLNENNDNALVVCNTYKCHDTLVLTKIIKKLIIEEPRKHDFLSLYHTHNLTDQELLKLLNTIIKKNHLFQKNMLPHATKFCDLIIEHKQ